MLVLQPRMVRFGAVVLGRVGAVAISRAAAKAVVEWGDLGPHAVFADVPEQKVTVRVRQTLAAEDPADLTPGTAGTLVVYTAPAAGDAGRRKITASVVLLSAESELKAGDGEGAGAGVGPGAGVSAVRVLTFVAVSSDGAADPLVVTDAGAEA